MLIAISFLAFAGIVSFVFWCAAVLAGRADRYLEDDQSEYGAPEGGNVRH